jgi:hypothetical protein
MRGSFPLQGQDDGEKLATATATATARARVRAKAKAKATAKAKAKATAKAKAKANTGVSPLRLARGRETPVEMTGVRVGRVGWGAA